MLFNSFEFALFFPIVTTLYFLLPHRWRWLHLLVASSLFYMCFVPVYLVILFLLIGVDYVAGIWISRSVGFKRKAVLIGSLAANLSILVFFKYFNFLNGNIASVFHLLGWDYSVPYLSLLLPIGLSFHTFQSMAYTIEIYRGNQRPERHLGIYALYVMFYPQLVAGPIERPQNLLHQFHEPHCFSWNSFSKGIQWIAAGLFMKIVIADRLAVIANTVFANPSQYQGFQLWVAIYAFAFQIYCDFAGYSHIARGTAKVMGFDLMVNFHYPYLSPSLAEFWRRWHISLSTWFKDYLYIPLGGNRGTFWRVARNGMIIFLVSGLWHGASWTFVVWGALHGFFLIASQLFSSPQQRLSRWIGLDQAPLLNRFLSVFLTFHLVCFAWIFFRASSLTDAFYIVGHLLPSQTFFSALQMPRFLPELANTDIALSVALVVVLMGLSILGSNKNLSTRLELQPLWIRWACYYGFLLTFLTFAIKGTFAGQKFIYFQF